MLLTVSNFKLDKYQQLPQLLDAHLETMLTPLVDRLRQTFAASAQMQARNAPLYRLIYCASKVRGYKTIGLLKILILILCFSVKFLSHETQDLVPILLLCSSVDGAVSWEQKYVLLLWLSLVVRIPFDLVKMNASSGDEKSIILQLYELGCKHITAAGKERDGAAIMLTRFLIRKDTIDKYLSMFLTTLGASMFEIVGRLTALSSVFLLGPRDVLRGHVPKCLALCQSLMESESFTKSSLVRKLVMKLSQRLALVELKPVIPKWRYQRGLRSLNNQALIKESPQEPLEESSQEDLIIEVSEVVESVIQIMFEGLRDKDTIVRWSASKGLAKITQRLPLELASDVVESVLDMFEENVYADDDGTRNISAVNDQCWHGASLTLAELARRGLLLPDKLPQVFEWMFHALLFEQRRGTYSIGAHIRDAACYVCWAFARAYSADIMMPHVQKLAIYLVIVSVYDREVNVRRAASAAFQENVGRQGIFPNGIDIVTIADFFAVGNRATAYLETSLDIAKFEGYRDKMVNHLVQNCTNHWDIDVRLLASQALGKFTSLDIRLIEDTTLPALIKNCFSKDFSTRHGAVLGVASIVLQLPHSHISDLIIQAPLTIAKFHPTYLQSFGSDLFRQALCTLIGNICDICVNISADIIAEYQSILKSSLERQDIIVQNSASVSYGKLSKRYPIATTTLEDFLACAVSENVTWRTGYTMLIGELDSSKYSTQSWHMIFDVLCKVSSLQSAAFAETRKHGVDSLKMFLRRSLASFTTIEIKKQSVAVLIACIDDYSTNSKGDIGSLVREAAMRSLTELITTQEYFADSSDCDLFVGQLLKQVTEKIDRVRATAGDCLSKLLHSNVPCIRSIHGYNQLIEVIPNSAAETWTHASKIFEICIPLLALKQYRKDLLMGVLTSVSGQTESLIKYSSPQFMKYLSTLSVDDTSENTMSLTKMLQLLADLIKKHHKVDRLLLPLTDGLTFILESGYLATLFSNNDSPAEQLTTSIKTVRQAVVRSKEMRKLTSAIKL